eukprot:Em0003g1877a
MDRIDKQPWFFGEMSADTAVDLLKAAKRNSFVVYKRQANEEYVISVRTSVGIIGDKIDHMTIKNDGNGQYWIISETTPPSEYKKHGSVIAAVTHFMEANPSLSPAVEEPSDGALLKESDAPPDYNRAERALQPEREPLPALPGSHWHYYRQLCCCHPKNTYHACCYVDTESKWKNCLFPCDKGPLRALGILICWLLICPCCPGLGCLLCLCVICCLKDDL